MSSCRWGRPRVRRRPIATVALAAALTAAGVAAGCSSDPPATSAPSTTQPSTSTSASPGPATTTPVPEGGLVALVERSRLFGPGHMVELIFQNHGAAPRQVSAYGLESPMFEPLPLQARDVVLRTGGGRTSMPMAYGGPRCAVAPTDRVAVIVAVVDGTTERLEIDPAPLRAQHDAECAEERVREVADLRFGDEWSPGSPGTIVGEVELVQRTPGAAVTVDEMAGTVIFSLRFPGTVEELLHVDDDRPSARTEVVVSASGCSPHALIESKKTYKFPTWVRLGDAPPVRIELEPQGAAYAAFEALLASCMP